MVYHETRDAALPEQQRLNSLTGQPHVIRQVKDGEHAGRFEVVPFKPTPKKVFTPII
jgi:hypothetical protein